MTIPIIMTISVNNAAKELDVRVDEIYRLIRSGRLKAVKVNRGWQIDYHSLQQHVANRGNNNG